MSPLPIPSPPLFPPPLLSPPVSSLPLFPHSLQHQTLLICQGGLDEFRRFSERHSFGAALSLCQALVHIVLLTAGLALLPCSLLLSPLCSSYPFLFVFPLFLCSPRCVLFLMVSAAGSWGEEGGHLSWGQLSGVFHPLCMDTHTHMHTHKMTFMHKNTHQRRGEGEGRGRWRGQHALFRGNLTALLSLLLLFFLFLYFLASLLRFFFHRSRKKSRRRAKKNY